MTFSDVMEYVKTGGQGSVIFVVWFLFIAVKRISTALDTLTDIRNQLADGRKDMLASKDSITKKVDEMHTAVLELPLNILRTNRR